MMVTRLRRPPAVPVAPAEAFRPRLGSPPAWTRGGLGLRPVVSRLPTVV